jgi:HPt (histidine-containing phosphotransfer) domain-containing protein
MNHQLLKAGIDVKGALVKFDNNEEFYETMLQEFVEAPEYEKLCQALLKGEVEQAFEEAHKLKGTWWKLCVIKT